MVVPVCSTKFADGIRRIDEWTALWGCVRCTGEYAEYGSQEGRRW